MCSSDLVIGERDAARPPLEQRDAEPIFEQPDLFADRPMRHMQILGGLDKAAVPGGSLEGADGVERRERICGHGAGKHGVPAREIRR